MDYTHLAQSARRARTRSRSPYSKFRVGSALLTSGGKVFTGCNIENSSFGLTICAERTALFKAVSEGYSRFRAIAVATDESTFVAPCGACRQVILELAGDIDVVLVNRRGGIMVMKASDLIPHPFGPNDLLHRKRRRS